MEIKDLIIVGGGPSGVSAAIYAKRMNLDFILFEKYAIGGQVINAFEIENYPGFNKIYGSDLAMNFYNNLNALNIDVKYEEIVYLNKENDIFILRTSDNKEYFAKKVILALGRKPRKLNLPREDEFISRGISFCAMCDGSFYKNKEVIVYGGGNSAVSESLFLTNIVKKLTIISRSLLRADETLINELKSKNNVEIIENSTISDLLIDENTIKGVTIQDKFTKAETQISGDGIFVYIGSIPTTGFLNNLAILTKEGYVEVNKRFETNIPNLYAIGDVINKEVRQIVTATSDGAEVIHSLLKK